MGFFQLTSGQSLFVGPCGFDVGYLLAEYLYTYHDHMLTPENNDWHRKISYQMVDAANETGRVISSSSYIYLQQVIASGDTCCYSLPLGSNPPNGLGLYTLLDETIHPSGRLSIILVLLPVIFIGNQQCIHSFIHCRHLCSASSS